MSKSGDVLKEPLRNIGAQDILKIEYTYSGTLRKEGNLERGLQKLSSVKWRQFFVVISKGCTYIYNDEASTQAKKCFSLRHYNRIERYRMEGGSQLLNYCFRLVSREEGVKHINLACTDEESRKIWMKQFYLEIRKANSLDVDAETSSYEHIETDIDSLKGKRPESSQRKKKSSLVEFSKQADLEYDEVEEPVTVMRYTKTPSKELNKKAATLPKPTPSMAVSPPTTKDPADHYYYYGNTETTYQQSSPKYSNTEYGQASKEFASCLPQVDIFEGDTTEASRIISQQTTDGVFLIRKGTETQYVLVVSCHSQAKNYANHRIYQIDDKSRICLLKKESEQHPSFSSLHALVEYYRESCLPASSNKLTSPYRPTKSST